MSKALTLALALVAGRAHADAGGGLLVSALFGTEPRRACITVGIIRGAITQAGSARQLQATRPAAWS